MGLVREQTKAYFLGTKAAADAFSIAFMIPNLLRRFLAEGIMSAAVVPIFTEYVGKEKEEEVRRFVCVLLGSLLLLLVVVVSAGVFLAPYYVSLFFPKFGPAKLELTIRLTAIMFPYIAFVSVASLLQGVLFSHGRFALSALCPVAFNVVAITLTWTFAPHEGSAEAQAEAARVMALAVLAGGLAQAALLIPQLLRLGYRLRPALDLAHAGLRRVGGLLLPVALGGGIHQINALVALFLAASVEIEGAVAALTYSNRLLELALGILVVSVVTVALPGLSRLWNHDAKDRYFAQTAFALRLVLLVTVPAGVGLLILRREIIAVLLAFGAFKLESVALTQRALLYHALSVPCVGCCRLFSQALYAARDTRTPLAIGTIMAGANMLLCFLLIGPLDYGGVALAMTLSSAAGVALYGGTWRVRYGRGSLPRVVPFAIRIVTAALLMAAFHAAWTRYLVPLPEGASRLSTALYLAAAVAADAGLYFAAVRISGVTELGDLLGTLVRRRRGVTPPGPGSPP
jgi:putative peptidoglycan lipid II flippase